MRTIGALTRGDHGSERDSSCIYSAIVACGPKYLRDTGTAPCEAPFRVSGISRDAPARVLPGTHRGHRVLQRIVGSRRAGHHRAGPDRGIAYLDRGGIARSAAPAQGCEGGTARGYL